MSATARSALRATHSSAAANGEADLTDDGDLDTPPETLVSFDRPVTGISESIATDPGLVSRIMASLATAGARQNARKFSLMLQPSVGSHEEGVTYRNTEADINSMAHILCRPERMKVVTH
jgi:hypothetical protein